MRAVEDCLAALVGDPPNDLPLQALWRERVFFEGAAELGGLEAACSRLLDFRYLSDFLALAQRVSAGEDTVRLLSVIVEGLNFLVCGFSSASEGLIVPDQACLSARDPGSFRHARPSLVHAQVRLDRLSLARPDEQLVWELLDIDQLDVKLVVDEIADLSLRIRPRIYEAIREAAAYKGPVGQGTAEMTDVRGFYGRLAEHMEVLDDLRVADPVADPPALLTLTLPHLAS